MGNAHHIEGLYNGAGIGGGLNEDGNVTIYGGAVKGFGSNGAGIGGGMGGAGKVTIYGGNVEGGSAQSSGIGGGASDSDEGGEGKVTISGGTVMGTSYGSGAGIGGSANGVGTVTIEEGVTCVQGTGGGSAPGIGSGQSGDGATISIADSLSYATSSSNMPADNEVQTTCEKVDGSDFLKYVKVMVAASESKSTSSSNATTIIPQWVPTTPEEIRAFTLFGSAGDVADGNFYEILNDDTATMVRMVQGPKCIAVMDAYALEGMELVRTYGILPPGFSLDNIIYTSDKELEVVLKIPTSLQEEGATFKMVCVSEDGMPYILDDLDTNLTTITFKTDKFYAFGLLKSINN